VKPQEGVAVVTGGSAGLGRAIVRELADRGWDVAVLARGADGVDGATRDAEQLGARAIGIEVDVSDRRALEEAADRVERELGPIGVWVNNAMVSVFQQFASTDPDDFERVIDVDFLGFVNGTRAALHRMAPRDRGAIIQVGSALAHRGIPLQAAYCSAKHAIKGFTESLAAELAHEGSRITLSEVDMPAMNTMQFSWVKSGLPEHPQPVPPIYQPEVGARVVADVAARPRRRVWVGESTVMTIWGNRLAPRAADRKAATGGFDGQQTDTVHEPMLGPNLYEPVPGDHGAHGVFGDRALSVTPETWFIRHRRLSTGMVVTALVAVVMSVGAARSRR
jgi:NAD(P)-dependent dehydrogenase (short-subunit alcohol dehydrogenase family)